MTSEATTPAGVCYRHPKRESWVLCQRCGRTICPSCQTQAAVGVHCPECVREGHAEVAPRRRRRVIRAFRANGDTPVVTYTLIGITVVVGILQFVTAGVVTAAGVYIPALTAENPWRMITAVFLHSMTSPLHLALNMLSLYVIGRGLEPLLGRWRFLALYLVSGFAGSIGVLLLDDPRTAVLGASGAVFGMFGAYLIIGRRLGANLTGMIVVVAANLAFGFFFSANISWQAHVGGLVGGALVGLVYVSTRRPAQKMLQIAGMAGLVIVLIGVTVAGYLGRANILG